VTGLIALHGGGEFLPGDELVLRELLEAADLGPAGRDDVGHGRTPTVSRARLGPLRPFVVPTAAARGRPDKVAADGVAAFERVAAEIGLTIEASVARVVDDVSAGDPGIAARLSEADLIHLPGGDPDLIPTLLPETAAWKAIVGAWRRGAVLAGASAGAMALADLTWTPTGYIQGLGLIPGVLVVPHADAASWSGRVARFGADRPAGIGLLGIAERTALIGRQGSGWRVVGQGEVRWLASDARDIEATVIGGRGDRLELPHAH
jgi:cyanophycinase